MAADSFQHPLALELASLDQFNPPVARGVVVARIDHHDTVRHVREEVLRQVGNRFFGDREHGPNLFENGIQINNFNYLITFDGIIASRGGIPLVGQGQTDRCNRLFGRYQLAGGSRFAELFPP